MAISFLVGFLSAGVPAPVHALARQAPVTGLALLEVPFVPQTAELCGGAALAMVLRYWGGRGVLAEDFSSLVDHRAGGIPTDVLTTAARDRGWAALVSIGGRDDAASRLSQALAHGYPVIALVEDTPRVYHYIVVVAVTESVVVFHDPARAPFRVVARERFDRAWAVTERWMLIVSRGATRSAPPDELARTAPDSLAHGTCDALVAQSVALANAGHLDDAEQGLVAATGLCPREAPPWRELAGVRFVQSRWDDAARLASIALSLEPDDAHSWRLAATSHYLQSQWDDALSAWNHVDEPRTDLIDVQGAARTRWPVVTRLVGLQSRQLLTNAEFVRAGRRLSALPSASATQLRFEPQADGQAKITAGVSERPMLPSGALRLSVMATHALIERELRVDVAGLSGGGELWTTAWRWSANRPRLAFRVAVPGPRFVRGIFAVDASWERESYGIEGAPSAAATQTVRRRAGMTLADWAPHEWRWQLGAALDHLTGHDLVSIDASLDKRLVQDRLSIRTSGGWWVPAGQGRAFTTGTVAVSARSTRVTSVPGWSGTAAIAVASGASPAIVWPGAGTGQGRQWLLRAHPLLHDGVIDGVAFGRRMAHASAEYERPLLRETIVRLSVAGFVDAARVWPAPGGSAPGSFLADGGIGLRVHASDLDGVIRIDLAYGLRDRHRALSIGWGTAWPQ